MHPTLELKFEVQHPNYSVAVVHAAPKGVGVRALRAPDRVAAAPRRGRSTCSLGACVEVILRNRWTCLTGLI